MNKLSELQRDMMNDVLGRNRGADALIAAPPRGSRNQRLDVYRKAYLLRLTEFLANDFEKLRRYLGDARFNDMARGYAAAYPSDNPNARWFSRHLPAFLKAASPYRNHPELAELALLEQALNDAFDGPDTPIITLQDLAAIDPQAFSDASFDLAPTAQILAMKTNVSSLWSCLKCEEVPPCAIDLDHPAKLLVWRQSGGSRFRILGDEEAMAIACMAEGLTFGAICEMIATFDDPDTAALRAAGYLRGWLEAEIISRIRLSGELAK